MLNLRSSLLLAVLPATAVILASACGSSVDDTPDPAWGCVQVSDAKGTYCTCSNPPPKEGTPVATCARLSGAHEDHVCCVFDQETCTCASEYSFCTEDGRPGWEGSCTHADQCPKSGVVEGGACSVEGMACPGEGDDPECFDWTCYCEGGTYACAPGLCA